jgi:Skp family chaperone for outer membrane proteins
MGSILDRLVARAIPADIEDPAQEQIAAEAAENALRPVLTVARIASVAVVAALAALLYTFWPSSQTGHGAALPAAVGPFGGDVAYAKLLQAKEEADGKLQQVITERDALLGKVADLERRLEALAKAPPQAAEALAESPDPAERTGQQAKVGALERQVAELTQKLHATQSEAAARPAHLAKSARPSRPSVSAATERAYRCGDGRTVRNPTTCRATAPMPSARASKIPDTYHCGDGRSVPNPAECRPADALTPRG